MTYETVIGLEVHVELGTKSKIFCSCDTSFGAPPNSHVCPVCMGSPGVLPVLNEEALRLGMKAALALNCQVRTDSKFDRKNYFYPDSPKAYQISQYDEPIGEQGYVEIEVNGEKKRIGITRVHLEEDAGKLNHSPFGDGSFVDFNRVGIPLIEIVSEPDLRTPEEARLYLEQIKAIMQYCEVSECKMEEGSLRCDANISLRPYGQEAFGTKAEIKNMNSFRNVERGLEFEQQRQEKALTRGEVIVQETRRFDEATGSTISMRGKEDAHDYRYFPDPDLPRIIVSDAFLTACQEEIPELPAAKRERFMQAYGLPAYDAGVLTTSRFLAEFFDATAQQVSDPKAASNWLMGDVLAYMNASGESIEAIRVTPTQFADLIGLIEDGTISTKIAKTVLKTMLDSGKAPKQIIEEQGLVQISDVDALTAIAKAVIERNPAAVQDVLEGKEKAIGSLVGQMMKETKGKANPAVVNQLLKDLILS
nr:Asp-tRNA(Asn)/Glu-tRNA(Gln) amidotransferase subunit GatB [Bacilli bacterium]